VEVVAPFDHKYDTVPDAPVTVAVAEPLLPPLQLTLTPVTETESVQVMLLTVPLDETVQPLASVTVTVYVPAVKPDAVEVVAPLDHK